MIMGNPIMYFINEYGQQCPLNRLRSLKSYGVPPPQRAGIDIIPACDHKYVLSKRTFHNKQTSYQRICTVCGLNQPSIKHDTLSPTEKEKAHEVDENKLRLLRESWNKRAWQSDTQSDDWWAWYNGYLQSEVWQERRERVLIRDKHVCQACLSEKAVHVHHLTYKNVGREPLFDLIAVCVDCHEHLHEDTRELKP